METVKGFRDFIGRDAEKREKIKEILIQEFNCFGFESVETPLVEYEKFVKGDNEKDEAVSDIFRLEDKGKRKLALRYEFTFQLKRIMNNQKLPWKRYQIGEVFRDEPVSGNRSRQFTQCDADIIGTSNIISRDEAEILNLAKNVFEKLKIKYNIYVNNRKLLNEILEKEKIKNKEQVIKEIDKLDKLEEKEVKKNLKKYNAEKLLNIFKKPESYFQKYDSYNEVQELKKYCNYYGIKFEFSPSLARGLSYYNGTIFEIKSQGKDSIKETITSGGSFMFNGVQCTGISFGLERLSILSKIKIEKEKYLVVSLDKDKEAIKLTDKLRKSGKNCFIYYGKPSKALQYANSKEIDFVIFVGEKEVKDKKFIVKNMKNGKENLLKI